MSLPKAGLVNSLFSLLGSAANVALVPLLLSVYGLTTFGALTLLTAIAQYFTVLDLGLSSALVRYAVRVRTMGDPTYFAYRRAIVALLAIVGLLLTGTASATAHLWAALFHVDHIAQLPLAVFSAGGLTVVTLIGNCYNSMLVAELRYKQLNIYNLLRNTGGQVVGVSVFALAGDLASALASAAVFSVALLGLHVLLLQQREPPGGRALSAVNRTALLGFARESVSFSAQYFVDAMVIPTLQSVVGIRIGPDANGTVDIARRLLFGVRRLIEAAFVPLFARASELIELCDHESLVRLLRRSTALTFVLAGGYYLTLRAFLPPLLAIWLGDRALVVQPVAGSLLVGVTFTIPGIAVYHFLSTSGRGRLMNALGSATTSAAMLVALVAPMRSTVDVLNLYATGTFLGTAILLAYAARLELWRGTGMRPSPARAL